MSCLHLRRLTVEFSTPLGDLRAVDEVSLDHEGGETLALIGETGCGKSVVAHAILGLLPDNAAVRGSVELGGRDLLAMSERELAAVRGAQIGIVLQNPSQALNPIHRIGRQIGEPLVVHRGLRPRAARPRVHAALHRLGFLDVERHLEAYPFQFSGGMNQRVLIAASLVLEPRILIADEPTKGLDAGLRTLVREEMGTIKRLNGSSLLLITHDLELARGIADRVAVMYGGQIIEVAAAERFFAGPAHPYARALLESLPENGFRPIAGPTLDMTAPPSGCRFHPRCPAAGEACARRQPELYPADTGPRSSGPRSSGLVRCLLYC